MFLRNQFGIERELGVGGNLLFHIQFDGCRLPSVGNGCSAALASLVVAGLSLSSV